MLKLLKKITLSVFAFMLCIPLSKAQFEADLTVGVCNYQGDLVDPALVKLEVQPSFGAFLRFTPNRFITIRGNYIQGKLKASDLQSPKPETRYRGIVFESTLREFSVVGEYNILGNSNENNFELGGVMFNPYIFAGIGLASNSGVPVAPADTRPYPFPEEGAKSVVPAFPLGIGLKVQFGESIGVGLDIGSRLTFSDYLDGVSKVGNPKSNDFYSYVGLTFSYCFGQY